MKQFILVAILVLVSLITFSQIDSIEVTLGKNTMYLPIKDNQVFYERIFNFESLSKDDIFKKSKVALIEFFNSNKVILNEDKDLGIITARGAFSMIWVQALSSDIVVKIDFNCIFQSKDNKCRVQFYNFQWFDKTLVYDNPSDLKNKHLLKSAAKNLFSFDKAIKDFYIVIEKNFKKQMLNDNF